MGDKVESKVDKRRLDCPQHRGPVTHSHPLGSPGGFLPIQVSNTGAMFMQRHLLCFACAYMCHV